MIAAWRGRVTESLPNGRSAHQSGVDVGLAGSRALVEAALRNRCYWTSQRLDFECLSGRLSSLSW